MKSIPQTEAGILQSIAPLTDDEKSLILSNLRLSVGERLQQHDDALHTLKQLRAAVEQTKKG